jgi:hypothetical protein
MLKLMLCTVLGAAAIVTPIAVADGAQVVRVPFRVNAQAKADIAACVGENVVFSGGEFNVVIHVTAGGFLFHRNVVGGVGVGTTTGTVYHATGHLQSVDVLPPSGGETFTFELTLNVVGAGNAGHFTAHAVEHLTFTPDGNLVSDVEIDGIRCE